MDKLDFLKLRKRHGLTQAQMGEALDPPASRQAIIKWERGVHPLPDDIENRLKAANLEVPQAVRSASKIVDPSNSPECYVEAKRGGATFRNLHHPKWWAGIGSPMVQLCTSEQWESIPKATMMDRAGHTVPTPEQARDMMVSRGVSHNDADRYLVAMRAIPEPNPRVTFFRDNPGASETEFYAQYPHLQPASAAPRESTSEEKAKAQALIADLDNAFKPGE